MSKFFYLKLATTNIKKNAKTYVPYIITCILTISMFYIIGSLSNNPNLDKAAGTDSMRYILYLGVGMRNIRSYILILHKQLPYEA